MTDQTDRHKGSDINRRHLFGISDTGQRWTMENADIGQKHTQNDCSPEGCSQEEQREKGLTCLFS